MDIATRTKCWLEQRQESAEGVHSFMQRACLLDLPQEIRDLILRRLLVMEDSAVCLLSSSGPDGVHPLVRKCYYALLLTCKTLRDDTIDMFWGYNVWCFERDYRPRFRKIRTNTSEKHLQRIKLLRIASSGSEPPFQVDCWKNTISYGIWYHFEVMGNNLKLSESYGKSRFSQQDAETFARLVMPVMKELRQTLDQGKITNDILWRAHQELCWLLTCARVLNILGAHAYADKGFVATVTRDSFSVSLGMCNFFKSVARLVLAMWPSKMKI